MVESHELVHATVPASAPAGATVMMSLATCYYCRRTVATLATAESAGGAGCAAVASAGAEWCLAAVDAASE